MIAVLADDLTGALEVGAQFAAAGLATVVGFDVPAEGAVRVVDTETRHASEAYASERVFQAAKALLSAGAELLYKKTDSTLRGHIGAELAAVSKAANGAQVLFVPAYPRLGRIVRDGCLLVNGQPVHETAFALDPLNPIRSSSIQDALGKKAIGSVHLADGETGEDILQAARTLLEQPPPRLAAGPAGLSAALAELLGTPRAPKWPKIRSALIVNGSLHPMAAAQCRIAEQSGLLHRNGWRLASAGISGKVTPEERNRQLGEQLAERVCREKPEALIVFGGDTAFAILQALGCQVVRPMGEVLPGVAMSHIDAGCHPLWLITKAGGFGDEQILPRLHELL